LEAKRIVNRVKGVVCNFLADSHNKQNFNLHFWSILTGPYTKVA